MVKVNDPMVANLAMTVSFLSSPNVSYKGTLSCVSHAHIDIL